ncbi:MAG: protein translocase subunit SecD, partial [Pseudomonadota bacterium]
MLHFSSTKIVAIAMVCLFGLIGLMPNFIGDETLESGYWPGFLPNKQLSLGLDLKGGAHLLLRMNEDELVADQLKTTRGDARKSLRDASIAVSGLGLTADSVRVRLRKPEDTDRALEQLKGIIQPVGNALVGASAFDLTVERESDGLIVLRPTSEGTVQRINSALAAAIEIIRKRIDSVGTTEPTIVRQGRDRILVQVPGFDDTKRLKALIGQTARVSFHDVHPTLGGVGASEERAPIGFATYPTLDESEGEYEYVVRERPEVSGEDLVDAQPSFDSRTNEPIITFRFNQKGARNFGEFTVENVGRPFAIVLDNGVDPETGKRDVGVISAPVIREPILGGTGQISGGFTVEAAKDLAVQIRSGALPATLTIIEERTVGPSLGADSIAAGEFAASIAAIAVAGFMIFAYGLFGLFSLVAVLVNLILIMGVMSMIGSTLTLPGIAGLILTVGMAVDANVLIYERIREEMRNGKPPITAMDTGFQRAFATIIDSNLTTLIAGIVMFWLGSGPVRGFAVTLSLGIFATMFTAFTVTRLLAALWVARQRTRKIPAPL